MYDYVIVGAGSAGCVLANRLSEDPDVSVLLLEAGGPDTNELVHLPAAFSALYRTAQDWDHSTIYEPFANDRRIYLPRGKVLGGSSSINAMIYIRGNPLDYDEWGPGWTWDEMLPYFKRAEDNERGEDEYHGAGGPLPVSEGRSRNELGQAFLDAAVAHGLPANEDFNGAEQDGVGRYQVTHRNGARASAAVAYLHPVMGRPNLTVETHVHALSILFEGGRAVGVVGARLSEMVVNRAVAWPAFLAPPPCPAPLVLSVEFRMLRLPVLLMAPPAWVAVLLTTALAVSVSVPAFASPPPPWLASLATISAPLTSALAPLWFDSPPPCPLSAWLPVSSTVSTDSPTGMPAARSSLVCGMPKPMRSSLNGEMLIEAPASLIASISGLVTTMAWMICMSLRRRSAL